MKRYLDLFKQAWTDFGEDKAQRLAAGLAYYTIFSIAPLLLIAIAIAGLVFGRAEAQAQVAAQLQGLFGDAGAKAIKDMLENAAKPESGVVAIVIGTVTLLFGAAGVFAQLKSALNTIWEVEEKKVRGIAGFIKERLLSFAMVLVVGFLLLVTLVIDAGLNAVGSYAQEKLPGGEAPWQIAQLIVSFAVVAVLFALIFRYLPDVRIEWRDVRFGAAFTAALFVIGKFALGMWLGRKSVGSAYGAAGSLVVLLLWIYWSASILFFGAEFTQVYASSHGSLRAAPKKKEEEAAAPLRPVIIQSGGGGAMKLATGGLVGLLLGAIVGGIGATVVFMKSVKKLFT